MKIKEQKSVLKGFLFCSELSLKKSLKKVATEKMDSSLTDYKEKLINEYNKLKHKIKNHITTLYQEKENSIKEEVRKLLGEHTEDMKKFKKIFISSRLEVQNLQKKNSGSKFKRNIIFNSLVKNEVNILKGKKIYEKFADNLEKIDNLEINL